jgi:hypothetical protein
MVSVSCAVNAARSAGERKRISVSIASVARRLWVSRPPPEASHLADDASAERNKIAGREMISSTRGFDGKLTKHIRRDDMGGSRRDQQAFSQPAPFPLFDNPHQTMDFESPQMIVHLLARHRHSFGQGRGGGRRRQFCQQFSPDRIESDCR